LTSSYEVPGRYSRWTVGFAAPPLQIEGKGLQFSIEALNSRGEVLVTLIHQHLSQLPELFQITTAEAVSSPDVSPGMLRRIQGHVVKAGEQSEEFFSEEDRSKQPSLFSLVRAVRDVLFFNLQQSPIDQQQGQSLSVQQQQQFGLVGAMGYDLAFQFEPVQAAAHKQNRADRDLVLFLPDELLIVDGQSPRGEAWKIRYDFAKGSLSTAGLSRTARADPYSPFKEGSFNELLYLFLL